MAEKKACIENVRNEAELLRRNQKLKAQQEYSNPEPPSRRNKPSELVGISTSLIEKEEEVAETEQRVADLEDRLEDLRRNSPAERVEETAAATEPSSGGAKGDEKSESDWRKQCAAIDYKSSTAQTGLDHFQRE